jgi:hypothetical protein
VANSVANGENTHAKRIRLDTAEWYRLLDHLAKMRQQETSEIADRGSREDAQHRSCGWLDRAP